jgi:hypothetical protein
MNRKTAFVFLGWLKLTQAEKEVFAREVNEYLESSTATKSLKESAVQKMYLGPLGGDICPYCGK